MSRKYTNVSAKKDEIFRLRAEGHTIRETAGMLGYAYEEVRELIHRENRKQRRIERGEKLRPQGRPRKNSGCESDSMSKRITELELENALLRNFLSEVGRR